MTTTWQAAPTQLAAPAWSTALLFSGFAVWVAWFVADFFLTDTALRRRVFWTAWLSGCLLAGLALLHRGWGTAATGLAFLTGPRNWCGWVGWLRLTIFW